MPIVWVFPDRHIEVTHLSERWLESQRQRGEETAQLVDRLSVLIKQKAPHLQQATPRLVKTADMPTTREDRHNWTLDKVTQKVRTMTQREKEDRNREPKTR